MKTTNWVRCGINLFVCVLLAALLAGCGDYNTPLHEDNGEWQPTPVASQPHTEPALADPSNPDTTDPLMADGDPLAKSTDPVLQSPTEIASDRMTGQGDPMNQSTNPTFGWYWINGSIQSGSVAISVNGVSIGRYSVHIDKEITKLCHPGVNTLLFTHYPSRGAGLCPVTLRILNGHAPQGSPPLMVYDTVAEATAPDLSGDQDQMDPSTQLPTPGAPTNPLPTVSPLPSQPITEMRTFTGE